MDIQKGYWIGVDLDGTLANTTEDRWREDGPTKLTSIGGPVPKMLERVKAWLAEGKDVRIFTARLDGFWNGQHFSKREVKKPIKEWCRIHLGRVLPITNCKDYFMEVLYDDRAVRVEKDTGEIIG